MQNEGLSALVLCQPETLTYATGAFPGVATYWRRAGAAFLIVPAGETEPLTAIVGDLQAKSFAETSGIADVRTIRLWVETDTWPLDPAKPRNTPRPAQFVLQDSLELLQDALHEKGISGRIGLELGFIPAANFDAFRALPWSWTDATRIVERLRSIKHPDEIARLRRAAEHAIAGLSNLMDAICEGMTAAEMGRIWKDSALAHAAKQGESKQPATWAYIAVAGDGFAPGGPAESGDIIKMDVGCVIDGYSSDGARSAVLGKPRPEAQKVYDALHRAFDIGLALMQPGRPLSDIYKATAQSMWQQGFDSYGRGHFGHGVGASIWSEEWPFISHDSIAVLEPGMVLAFETPWYIDGLGGFIIEDQLLITPSGHEVMAPLPRALRRL